jgi:hypothetical protein
MSNLSNTGSIRQVSQGCSVVQVELYAGAKAYEGAMICRRIADGYGVRAGTTGTGRVQGIARASSATCTVSGDTNVNLLTGGVFAIAVHASTPPVLADIGKLVYASDDQTVSRVPSDGPIAGTLVGFEDATLGSGAALVLITPEPAVDTGYAYKEIPIYPSMLAAGTPMAAFADNAASAPGITLADSKAMGIRYNNAAAQVAVWTRFLLPDDIDVTLDAVVEVYASKTGATVGDATTFTLSVFNAALGALHDADTDFGGATSAMTGNATAKTVQKVTRTLALADLGVAGEPVSLSFKPTDGTLGTDDVIVHGMKLKYRRRAA